MSEKEKEKKKEKASVHISLKMKFSAAMILMTITVILSMAFYFIDNQSKILLNDIMNLAERETQHFAYTVRESLSTDDELTVISALDNVKKLRSVTYAHVLDPSGLILHSTVPEYDSKVMDDELSKKALSYENPAAGAASSVRVLRQNFPDSSDPGGVIYDFSLPVYDKLTGQKRIATVRMGFSDTQIRSEIRSMQKVVIVIAGIFIVASAFIALLLASITTRPLKKLSEGVSIIGTGDLDHKIRVSSRDEIGSLAEQFNAMTGLLKDAQRNEIESRIMQEQLDVAKEIQEGLNPMSFYCKNGLEIKGYTRAAKGVGGDYFDYSEIDENRIGALISDVSGKGIPASLVMVMIRTVFVSAIHQDPRKIQCSRLVSAINSSISSDFAIDKFATLFFLIYDKSTGRISFSNAGHGPLFCYRADRNACTVTKLEGVPIGIMDDTEYTQAEVDFNVGDIIILNTDGVTEMRNEKKDEYGRTRVQKFLTAHHEKNAEEIVKLLVEDVDGFKGNAHQHDDMTLVVIKRVK
ncbi:MAG: SpoIIE family protein phosphatase [Spirochaetota bacterium]